MTAANQQLPIVFSAPRQSDAGSSWLGLIVDHWQLFDALQDEWLRPPDGDAGRILGVRAFAGERDAVRTGNRISAYLQIDPARLPRIEISVWRGGQWISTSIQELQDDEAIFWPGALPAFAISAILVATSEEQVRLAGLARQVSNVSLPENALGIRPADVPLTDASMPPGDAPSSGLVLPPHMDATRGATAMAVWAVPRIDPWLDVLVSSLAPSPLLAERAAAVGAPWWAWPPWCHLPEPSRVVGLQERLWLAAARTFRELHGRGAIGDAKLAYEIAATATRDDSEADSEALHAWADETRAILRGDKAIHLDDWKSAPVGKAIQLVLARPEPSRFKSWFDDYPALSPTVWWSAAALCGLLHGYRRLDVLFRGDAVQRRLLSIHAASTGIPAAPESIWPDALTDTPRWRRDSGRFVLSWAGTDFASKAEHPRARWYTADLNGPDMKRSAQAMSHKLGWSCVHRECVVSEDDLSRTEVPGKVRVRIPPGEVIEEVFDMDEFRRCLVIEGGHIPEPPQPQRPATRHLEVPGLLYVPEFLSPTEEAALVEIIDRAEWLNDLRRRVQHYGWRYNYKARQVDASMRLGPLPSWAGDLARRLADRGLLPHIADQVIVNEYRGKQGISTHIDCVPCFADGIAMISLLESWQMIFKETRGGRKVPHLLERRSVAVLTGESRYEWFHEIPMRSTEPGGIRRQRRISITFRKVKAIAAS